MSVAIVLPARLKSTRLPNKLLLDRSGKTVLEHTIARALEARALSNGNITKVLVACDDEKLIAAAHRAGVEAVMTRADHQSGTDRVAEVAAKLEEVVIVNLQADEPEIDPQAILLVSQQVASAPMGTLAVRIFDEATWLKPNVVKVVCDHAGRALYFSRAPIPFARNPENAAAARLHSGGNDQRRVYGLHHIGIYAYRRDFLLGIHGLAPSPLEQLEKLEQLRVLENGHAISVGIVESNPPGIDTPEDYEAFLERQRYLSANRTVAILEDNMDRQAEMKRLLPILDANLNYVLFDNVPAFGEWFKRNLPKTVLISLDHDLYLLPERNLDPGDGRDAVKELLQYGPCCPVIIHTSNSNAATRMQMDLEEKGWECVRVVPFNDMQWIEQSWIHEVRKCLNKPETRNQKPGT